MNRLLNTPYWRNTWQVWLIALMVLTPFLSLTPANAQTQNITDPNVYKTWARTDYLVANQSVARSWMWGPSSYMYAGFEDYEGASGGYGKPVGQRLVFYFDKSRMETNNLNGDRNSKWFITNGLLVKELISGKRATGDNSTVSYLPANVPIAGDTANNAGPTYASFYNVVSLVPDQNAALNATGQPAIFTIDANGNVGQDLSKINQVKNAHYDPTFGHNIPQPFWNFMNSTGNLWQVGDDLSTGSVVNGPVVDWIYSTGYPITEPYWTKTTVAGQVKDVLVQAFERRVLTYTPSNDPQWRVEMGNVGLHYYQWRYQSPLPVCDTPPVRGFGKIWSENPSVKARIGCPYSYTQEQNTRVAIQNFQHGKMIWVDSINTPNYYPEKGWFKSIYILFDDGSFTVTNDTWDSSQPETAGLTAPAGLYEPRRGFGKVWRNETGLQVRDRLGWATEPTERFGDGSVQNFSNGLMHWIGTSKEILVLYRYYNQISTWEMYKDTFIG